MSDTEPLIFVGMPTSSNHPSMRAAEGFFLKCSAKYKKLLCHRKGSALAHNFNSLWSSALNLPNVTHFAMLHDDLIPGEWWVDILLDELDRTDADVVSAVNAIKDHRGLTSTAVGDPDDQFDYRRITTTELQELPETFSIQHIPETLTDGFRTCLLVNTGCWLCDLRRPFWRETNEDGTLKFTFTQNDRITYDDSASRYVVEFAPEDWQFSRECYRAGAKVVATRKVTTQHEGVNMFTVDSPWGEFETDNEAVDFHKMKPLSRERLLS